MDNLGRLLLEKFESISGAPALNDTGETLPYRVLAGEALKVASALNSLGVSEDEPVLVSVANEARDVSALIGVWLAGGVVVPVGRHSPYAAIDGLCEITGARFVITNDETELVTRVSHQEPPIRPLLEGAALIIFTSGTTGRPKGVVLSHHAFVGKLHAIDEMLNFTQKTRTLLVLQITFVFGLWVTLLTLLKGGTVWMHRRFDPVEVLTVLKDKHISDVALVPTMIRKIMTTCSRSARRTMSSGSTRMARSGRFSTSSLMRASNFALPTIPTLRPKLRKVPRRSFSMAMALTAEACDGSAACAVSDCAVSSHAPGDKARPASSVRCRVHRCGPFC